MDEKELLKLKDQIESAKVRAAELKGRQDHLLEELETKWDCKTIEQAEKMLENLQDEIETVDGQIDAKLTEIEEHFGSLL